MCNICNLEIDSIEINSNCGNLIILNSKEFDIIMYTNKFKMGNRNLNNIPWCINYTIVLNGKIDWDSINILKFGSDEMITEIDKQKNGKVYIDSFEKLKNEFWDDNKLLKIDHNTSINMTLKNGRSYNNLQVSVDIDDYPNIPKIKFNRTEDNIIE